MINEDEYRGSQLERDAGLWPLRAVMKQRPSLLVSLRPWFPVCPIAVVTFRDAWK
jgi:hypothetical protein